MMNMRDLIIIGSGPAGLTAAIYGKRAGLDTLVIDESGMGGGQVVTTYEVDNYPGLPGIGGFELGEKFKDHAKDAGAEFLDAKVTAAFKNDDVFNVTTSEGLQQARALIIATGAQHNRLNVPGEGELLGMGVSYCATCDGAFFKNRVTAVVGGGDVALEDALFLARSCTKVYLIHRRDSFRGAKKLVDLVKATHNIEIVYDSIVTEIYGEYQVEGIKVDNVKSGDNSTITIDGIFIAVGMHPTTEAFSGLVELDDKGYVIAGEDGVTSTPGVFAAGDSRTKKVRQIVTAAADGANAVQSVTDYFNSMH